MCHVRHNITLYPSYIFYPTLDQPDFDQPGAKLNFYLFRYSIRPESAHFRVLHQFAIESQESHQSWENSSELSFMEKLKLIRDTYLVVYTHRIYKYSAKINGEEN